MAQFAAIFDFDGVIVDSNPAHEQSIASFCRDHGLQLSSEVLRTRVFGRRNDEWLRDLFGRDLMDAEVEQLSAEKERLFRREYAHLVACVPGVCAFIEMLRWRSVPLALATSAPLKNVLRLMEQCNLSLPFDVILDKDSVREGKPNPEIYLKAASHLDTPPARCVVFEDSLAGLTAGKRAGSKTVALTTTHSADELSAADLVIEDFRWLRLDDLSALWRRVRVVG